MLACEDLTVRFNDAVPPVLNAVKAVFEPAALNAVVGPSGCGKTTLLKAMLGILPVESGLVYLGKQPVKGSDDLMGRVGFAPQFTTAHSNLSVEEALRSALDLFVFDTSVRSERLDKILKLTGLEPHREKLVGSLSGGQLRRLGLGLEMVNDPVCMVCDEVTSGLDPRSEDQILELLQTISREEGKTFINIIHNLGKLHYFDTITVLFEGSVVFQGTLKELKFYFDLDDPMHLYDKLNAQPLTHWQKVWAQYSSGMSVRAETVATVETPRRPSLPSQVSTLLGRRLRLLFRDRGYLLLTLAITFGFPCVVAIFALGGLPQIETLSLQPSDRGFLEELRTRMSVRMQAAETASLVTGLVMFQVVLLTLMASNTGAREIATERHLYEKERLNGLRPSAYALSKLCFVSGVSLFQGTFMTLFVKFVCGFPGPLEAQLGILCLCCVSMSFICLGFSALVESSERASLLSIYLVGFQLPLSGVVLEPPAYLVWLCRPFINAYWSWSGYVTSMRETRIFDAMTLSKPDLFLADTEIAALVLGIQALIGVLMVTWGCQARKWS